LGEITPKLEKFSKLSKTTNFERIGKLCFVTANLENFDKRLEKILQTLENTNFSFSTVLTKFVKFLEKFPNSQYQFFKKP
jgi:hypothetical protein